MINPQSLAQMMRLNQQDTAKLESVWQQAQNLSSNINSQEEALNVLKQNGVNSQFLSKVQGWLNNPMAGMVAKMAGVDLTNVRNAINTLNGSGTAPQQAVQPAQKQQPMQLPAQATQTPQQAYQPSSMDRFRQGLQQLRGVPRR